MRRDSRPGWRLSAGATVGRALAAVALALAACYRRAPRPAPAEGPVGRVVTPEAVNATDVYRRAGFLTATGGIPFVGAARFLAGPDAENTLVVLALSFPNRNLTFTRDGEQYRAAYDVSYDVRAGANTVQHRSARSEVRVGSFRETTRSEESVIAQQMLTLAPGEYTVEITAHDAGGANEGKATTSLVVPRFTDTRLSVTPVYQVTARLTPRAPPALVANPRSTVVFGRDSLLLLYVESYGARASRSARIEVAVAGDGVLYSDSVSLSADAEIHSGMARLPVSRLGFGVLAVTVTPRDGDGVAIRFPIVVRLGDELAVASFEEMLQYLRFFTSPERLHSLRDTTPDARGATWANFLRETDPISTTPENEALRDYLRRVQTANAQFREEDIPGWLTDRGKAYSAFGEPDQITEPSGGDASGRGMTLVWDYRDRHFQLAFVDQSGTGQFRMTPTSQLEFDAALRRLTSCATCR